MNSVPESSQFAVKTTCPYCGVGCGVLAQVEASGTVKIAGDQSHPANYGRLCSKGSALGETLSLDDRLLYPEIRGQRVSWSVATEYVANQFANIIAHYGPESIAFYVSGQLLTEDYYVANKLIKGFIGSSNIDTNSRLCMSSAVAAHKRAFGADSVPVCYEDLEEADVIVLVGSNLAWCHPVLFQRILAAQKTKKITLVTIDPRKTVTAEQSDLHLPIKPGSDVWLFNGLLNYLRKEDHLDFKFLETHTTGFADTMTVAKESATNIPVVALNCAVDEEVISKFYRLFATTEKVVTVFSQGVNQSSSGVDKANSIINCHLATGRIGKPGAGPFSITGQPNAMGGREVGGLANMLAAHMDFDNSEHKRIVSEFWNAPNLAQAAGLKAVDLFSAIESKKIRAVWIMATNPVVSMPDSDRVAKALAGCEFVVVSDCMKNTDTTPYAHVLLPAATWGEKSGTVTNSERRISRQRAFLPLPGESRPDWWILSEVAKAMGYGDSFSYDSPAQIFVEHAQLSGFENSGMRDFDISAFSTVSTNDYDNITPVQWPVLKGQDVGQKRLFSDGLFYTHDRKAKLVPVSPRGPVNPTSEQYPFVLDTGRVRDHWHTMTRTGKSPRLSQHTSEPLLEINIFDANKLGLVEGDFVELSSNWGEIVTKIRISDSLDKGVVFLPIHWSSQNSKNGGVGKLVNPAVDPISGQPELKHTPVSIRKREVYFVGYVLSREKLNLDAADYWVLTRDEGFYRYEIACFKIVGSIEKHARDLLGRSGEWMELSDSKAGIYRCAKLEEERLKSCLFVSSKGKLPDRAWLGSLFNKNSLDISERRALLSGAPVSGAKPKGKIVCACFGVPEGSIREAIKNKKLNSVIAIGEHLKAGTNCGSCIPEIKKILEMATLSDSTR